MVTSARPSEAMHPLTNTALRGTRLLLNKTDADELVAVSEKSLVSRRSRFIRRTRFRLPGRSADYVRVGDI